MNLLFSTSGRIPRWKFWLAYLPILFGTAPLIIFIENHVGKNPILIFLVIGLYAWMAVSLAAKRLHDTNTHGGFSAYILLVPLIAAIVIGARPGTRGENQFGPDPLESNTLPSLFVRFFSRITMRGGKGQKPQSGERQKENVTDRWNALVRYDDEIRAAAEKLRPFGESWVNELAQAYLALNEDRKYLPNIVGRLIEEAERDIAQRWKNPFRQTSDGNLCTQESLNILREAEVQGYTFGVEKDKTFTVTKSGMGTSYLRSNSDIQQFGRFSQILPPFSVEVNNPQSPAKILASFREPMKFPKGTTLYETKGPRVAVLADYALIMDDGGLGGRFFESAAEYREQTGDQEDWKAIRQF